jgi:hypothetical protein
MEGVSEERLKELVQQVKSSGSQCITIDANDKLSFEQVQKLKQENIDVCSRWIPELNHGVVETICYDKDIRKTKAFQNPKPKPLKKSDDWGFFTF